MSKHVRIPLLIAVVLALGAAPASAARRPVYKDARQPVAKRVADLLSRMTLEEKVGQMTQAERTQFDTADDPSDNDDLITTWRLGSILSGGGSTPTPNTPEAWADMVDRFQRRGARDPRCGIPLIYGVDSVHGHGNLLGATVFPHNIGLGATRDPDLVREVEHITADGDARDRAAVDVRAVHLRRARRPLGPHVRELRRGPAARRARWRPRSTASRVARPARATATACSRPPSTTPATATRTYGTGDRRLHDRPGHHGHQPPRLLEHLAAPVPPRGAEAPRRQRDAVLLERRLDRGRRRHQRREDARQPRADHRRAQGQDAASTAS